MKKPWLLGLRPPMDLQHAILCTLLTMARIVHLCALLCIRLVSVAFLNSFQSGAG